MLKQISFSHSHLDTTNHHGLLLVLPIRIAITGIGQSMQPGTCHEEKTGDMQIVPSERVRFAHSGGLRNLAMRVRPATGRACR